MRRRLLAAAFVAMLLVQPVSGATYPDAAAACGQAGDGEVLIGVLPGSKTPTDGQVLDGETNLYPGTTLRLALCKDGELKPTRGSEWSLRSSPGLEVLDRTDATVTVRVTDATDRVDVPALVEGKQDLDGVAVAVQRAPTAESELVEDAIAFESDGAASEYAETERAYLASLSNLSAAADRLNESAAALESGEGDPEAVTEEVLPALNQSRESVGQQRAELETQLYETAWRSGDDRTALRALSAAQARQREAEAEVERAMSGYLAELEAAEQRARSEALVNLGGAALAGLLVGAVPGWWLTASRLEDIRFDRQVNASVSAGPGVLARAGGLALAALALTAGALVALGGLEILGGLL